MRDYSSCLLLLALFARSSVMRGAQASGDARCAKMRHDAAFARRVDFSAARARASAQDVSSMISFSIFFIIIFAIIFMLLLIIDVSFLFLSFYIIFAVFFIFFSLLRYFFQMPSWCYAAAFIAAAWFLMPCLFFLSGLRFAAELFSYTLFHAIIIFIFDAHYDDIIDPSLFIFAIAAISMMMPWHPWGYWATLMRQPCRVSFDTRRLLIHFLLMMTPFSPLMPSPAYTMPNIRDISFFHFLSSFFFLFLFFLSFFLSFFSDSTFSFLIRCFFFRPSFHCIFSCCCIFMTFLYFLHYYCCYGFFFFFIMCGFHLILIIDWFSYIQYLFLSFLFIIIFLIILPFLHWCLWLFLIFLWYAYIDFSFFFFFFLISFLSFLLFLFVIWWVLSSSLLLLYYGYVVITLIVVFH